MIERAHELVRKAKENVRQGNIQEAANLYSDAAEIYQNMYEQTNNEEAKKTIQQLFVQTDKEAKRIMRLIIDKQNKDNMSQQQSNNSTPILSATSTPSPVIPSLKHQEGYDPHKMKSDNIFTQNSNAYNTPNSLNSPANNTGTPILNSNNYTQQNYGSMNQNNSPFKTFNNTNPKITFNSGNNNNPTLTFPNNGTPHNQPIPNKNQELNAVRQNVLYKSNRPKPALDTRNVASRNYFIGQAITNSAIILPQNNYQDNTRTVTANYKNHEPAVIPVTSLNSSTIDENTSSHYIDQSYFVLKETKKDEAEKAFIKFWDVIDNLVQNKVSMPVALLSVPLSKDDTTVNPIKKDTASSSTKTTNRNSLTLNKDAAKKNNQKSKNEAGNNDYEIIDQKYIQEAKNDINFSESDYLVIPQKEQPTKTLEEYQLENVKLKETLNQISNDYLLLPNTDEFKLALRKAKEYVKYNEYLRSSVVAGSENELEELKKRVAYLEENNLVKQIMQLEEENKALKMENDKLKQDNIKYKNQWEKFVAIAEAKKKKKSQGKRPELITNTRKIIQEDGNNSDIESPHLFNKPQKNAGLPLKYSSSNDSNYYSSNPPLQLFKNTSNSTTNTNTNTNTNSINQKKINSATSISPPVEHQEDEMMNPSLNEKFQQNQLYFSSPTPEFDILQHMNYHQEIASQSNQLYSSMINQPTSHGDYPYSPITPEIYNTPPNINNETNNNINHIKRKIDKNSNPDTLVNLHTTEKQ